MIVVDGARIRIALALSTEVAIAIDPVNSLGEVDTVGGLFHSVQQTHFDAANTFVGGNRRTPIDKEDIKADLTSQRPVYPLSCYGPGKNAPRQLIEGNVEISPEELRLRYYTQRASVGEPAAVS